MGRHVNFWPIQEGPEDKLGLGGQPMAAIVTHVWDSHCVNLAVFGMGGDGPYAYTSVPLVQPGEEPPGDQDYCSWMAYQKGQAAKTEAAEKKLHETEGAQEAQAEGNSAA